MLAAIKLYGQEAQALVYRYWLWIGLLVTAAMIHGGTAVLRLTTFFPIPNLADFASYYVGAWALRQGISPYNWSPQLLNRLQDEMGLFRTAPTHHSPPLWALFQQPLTLFPFPLASIIWLIILLLLVGWSAHRLLQTAGYVAPTKWQFTIIFLAILTIGPMFLTLTLGQNSLFMLVAALFIGPKLDRPTLNHLLPSACLWLLAAAAKFFPLTWLLILPFLRRWRLFFVAGGLCFFGFVLMWLVFPEINADYWLRFLPERTVIATEAGLDDQSFTAWLERMGRPQRFAVPGLHTKETETIQWTPRWSVAERTITVIGWVIVASAAIVILLPLYQASAVESEAWFYLWILYILLIFPHMARYNHVLLLPAMAWLWRQCVSGKKVVILIYFLLALSRLNHLWSILLPAPWGPLATGFGVLAVILLIVSIWWQQRIVSFNE